MRVKICTAVPFRWGSLTGGSVACTRFEGDPVTPLTGKPAVCRIVVASLAAVPDARVPCPPAKQ